MNDTPQPDFPKPDVNVDQIRGDVRFDSSSIDAEIFRGASKEIDWSSKLRIYIPRLVMITLFIYVSMLIYLAWTGAAWFYVASQTTITLACLVTLGVLAGKLAGHAMSNPAHIFNKASGAFSKLSESR